MSYLSRDNIKVKIKLKESETLLCQATVIFFDVIEIHGWRVMKSTKSNERFGEYLWIQGPSINVWGKWKEIVFINDKDTWDLVHEMIYDAFCMARSKKAGLEGVNEAEKVESKRSIEEVNDDDIQF